MFKEYPYHGTCFSSSLTSVVIITVLPISTIQLWVQYSFDQLQKMVTVKFFAFSEKYLDPKGYCDDSAYHFEICDGQIVKSVANYQRDRKGTGREIPQFCQNCKYDFYKPYKWDENSLLAQFLKIYRTETGIENDMLWDAADEEL